MFAARKERRGTWAVSITLGMAIAMFPISAMADPLEGSSETDAPVADAVVAENIETPNDSTQSNSAVFRDALVAAELNEPAVNEAITENQTDNAPNVIDGQWVIDSSGTYDLSAAAGIPVLVTGDIDVTLRADGSTIDASGTGYAAIAVANGARVTLDVSGTCLFTGDVNHAGIQVAKDSSLKIKGDGSTASIKAIGNAGIDYSTSADGKSAGYTSGAGIGGGSGSDVDCGTISIDGSGQTLTVSAIGGGRGASGIGSGYGGSATKIEIDGMILSGIHGGCHDAAIEGSAEYSKNTLEGGCGIGGGTKGTAGGDIVISGCLGSDIAGGGKSSGIGGGCWANETSVTISNSTLDVEGGTTGAAIGTGRVNQGTALSVVISNSDITARGGYLGAGIGLGVNGSNYKIGLSHVTISDSNVVAYGGTGAAGIGGGARGYNVSIDIEGASDVRAYAGNNYMGKYTERYNGAWDAVTEGGTIGQSGAAGIGRGAWGSVDFTAKEAEHSPSLTVSKEANVKVFSGGDNWAIAGFIDSTGVDNPILQGRFNRNYDLAGNSFVDRSADEAMGDEWKVCYLDGNSETVLNIRDADSLRTVMTFALPETGDEYAHGYTGTGRLGYYSFAVSVPSAGDYKVWTDSDVRSMDREGDTVVSSGDDGYLGGATYFDDGERLGVFNVENGISTYDRMAFRIAADPEPEPEIIVPDPDPVDPDPIDPAPGDDPEDPVVTPDDPDEPDDPDDPADEPVVPVPPLPDDGDDDDGDDEGSVSPVPHTPSTTDSDQTGANGSSTGNDPATPAQPTAMLTAASYVQPVTTPPIATAPVAAPVNAPVAPPAVSSASRSTTVQGTPATESIEDGENPLAAFDGDHGEDCWVHWWILLGIIVTAVYSAAVVFHRQRHSHKLDKIDDEIMGDNREQQTAADYRIGNWPYQRSPMPVA